MSNIQRARRIPNANGQILIENWVEERATDHLDHRIQPADGTGPVSQQQVKKTSHTALLTDKFTAPLDNVTTYRDNYDQFGPFEYKPQGARRQRLEQELTRQVETEFKARQREHEENLRQQRINDANSEYRTKYNKEFESKPPAPTQVSKIRILFLLRSGL